MALHTESGQAWRPKCKLPHFETLHMRKIDTRIIFEANVSA